MKIMVYNFKGGQGKTDIALNLAMTLDMNLLTNEVFSPVEVVLKKGDFHKLSPGEKVPELPDDIDILFDFGGYVDERATAALRCSDKVIIPVVNEFKDVFTTIRCIQEVEEINRNIIIVANKTIKSGRVDDYQEIKEIMKEHYPDYPVLNIKKSRAMPNLLKERISIAEMVSQGGLKKHNFQTIKNQFDLLMEEIKNG